MDLQYDNLISIVIPCYCSQKTIGAVVAEVIGEFEKQSKYTYEMILVNDCSKDGTADVIRQLAKENHKIVAVDFSRNFGQHSALMAGFQKTRGKYVACFDDDGQMPIESLFGLIAELEKGADVAFGRYEEIKQKWYRNLGSKVNVWMTELLLEKPKELFMSSFWAGKRFVIDELLKYDSAYPYIGGLLLRVTRNMVSIPVKERERVEGRSGYNFWKLINLWMNGFTAFSVKPLRFATFCGCMCALVGFLYGIITIIHKIVNPDVLMGYASLVTIVLFVGGIIMMLLGLMGEYLGRIYICLNKAPQYVVREVVDFRDGDKIE